MGISPAWVTCKRPPPHGIDVVSVENPVRSEGVASEVILETIDRCARVLGQKGSGREPQTGKQTKADAKERPRDRDQRKLEITHFRAKETTCTQEVKKLSCYFIAQSTDNR